MAKEERRNGRERERAQKKTRARDTNWIDCRYVEEKF